MTAGERDPATEPANRHHVPAHAQGPRGTGAHIATILLVEDNEDNQEIYQMILVHEGHSVLQAYDGRRGVEMARAHGPDLVLMDLSMPVMNGLEATRLLKADPATAGIPVVALTACTQDEDVAAALRAGCDAFLAKPLEPRRVAAEVRRILANGDAASAC